jgi:hypothetical protein
MPRLHLPTLARAPFQRTPEHPGPGRAGRARRPPPPRVQVRPRRPLRRTPLARRAGRRARRRRAGAATRPPRAGHLHGQGQGRRAQGPLRRPRRHHVIFDHDLSPKQIANIEETTVERKVLDRSELILDIFAGRAATTRPSSRSNSPSSSTPTHASAPCGPTSNASPAARPAASAPAARASSSSRSTADSSSPQDRPPARTPEIQARKRRGSVRQRNLDHFTVGLVGYTNAGKSTLFNTLTAGGAYADDRLFATLMTRTREWDLGGGHNAHALRHRRLRPRPPPQPHRLLQGHARRSHPRGRPPHRARRLRPRRRTPPRDGPIRELDLSIPLSDPKTIDTVERICEVLDRNYEGDRAILRARIGARQLSRLHSISPGLQVFTPQGDRVDRESNRAGWRR